MFGEVFLVFLFVVVLFRRLLRTEKGRQRKRGGRGSWPHLATVNARCLERGDGVEAESVKPIPRTWEDFQVDIIIGTMAPFHRI